MKDRMINRYRFLDYVVASVVFVFMIVVVLLTIALLRNVQLQQAVNESSLELRDNVEVLQETTGELQETVDRLREQVPENSTTDRELAALDESLSQMEEQLDDIEQAVNEVVPLVSHEDPLITLMLSEGDEVETIQDDIHRLFTAAAWLIGVTGMVTAVVAWIVFNPLRPKARRRRLMPDQPAAETESRESP